jgi:uncharacterized OB-fold protein
MTDKLFTTPPPVMGIYDKPMWDSINKREMSLQCCSDCEKYRYPPGPVCPVCLSPSSNWRPVSGRASILSWVIFHRQYLSAYPAPYNVIAVRLEEGPVMISNLAGQEPEGAWIGRDVNLIYHEMPDGKILPRFCTKDTKEES